MKLALGLLLCLGCWVTVCVGNAFLSIRFLTFHNPKGEGSNGHCCDGRYGFCITDCDHSFNICVDQPYGSNSMNRCAYGRKYSHEISNQNYIKFGAKIGRLDNPMIFSMTSWPGSVLLKVDVVDIDPGANDHVDFLTRKLVLWPSHHGPGTQMLIRRRAGLLITARVYCGQNYYSPNCSVLCAPAKTDHYTCDQTTGGKVCHRGWTGTGCDVNIDDCARVTCSNGGTCRDLTNDYRCECAPGFTGRRCDTDIDECLGPNPCLNGVCRNTHGSFSCDCREGYTGKTCGIDVLECESSPCQNGAVCTDRIADFHCACPRNFKGKTCAQDVDECTSEPCQNNATCVNTHGSFHCACVPGYAGNSCEEEIDECASAPCQNGGNCTDLLADFDCLCPPGFQGRFCESNINECEVNFGLCQHGGQCVDTHGDYSCNCTAFWEGDHCVTNVNECIVDPPPCSNGGTCVDVDEGFTCDCPPGLTGALCENDIDECQSTSLPLCQNGGNCQNVFGSFICSCADGWHGDICSIDVDECLVPSDLPGIDVCGNGGLCVNTPGSYNCDCPPSWTGRSCQVDLDECESSPCTNGGSCLNAPGTFQCVCQEGWTGHLCGEDIDECAQDANICYRNASDDNSTTSTPQDVFANSSPNSKSPDNEDIANRTICVNNQPGYTCACVEGWTGERCDVELLTSTQSSLGFTTTLPPVNAKWPPGLVGSTTPVDRRGINNAGNVFGGPSGPNPTPNIVDRTGSDLDESDEKTTGNLKGLRIPLLFDCRVDKATVDRSLRRVLTARSFQLKGSTVEVEATVSHIQTRSGKILTSVHPTVTVDGSQLSDEDLERILSHLNLPKVSMDMAKYILPCSLFAGDRSNAKTGASSGQLGQQTGSKSGMWFPAVLIVLALLLAVAVVVAMKYYRKRKMCRSNSYGVNSPHEPPTTAAFHNNIYTDSIFFMTQGDHVTPAPDVTFTSGAAPSSANPPSGQPTAAATTNGVSGQATGCGHGNSRVVYQNDGESMSISNPLYKSMDEGEFPTRKESMTSVEPPGLEQHDHGDMVPILEETSGRPSN